MDLHEGCGRIKLFWIMALADSKTLKAMIEFREGRGEFSDQTLSSKESMLNVLKFRTPKCLTK